MLKDIKQAEIDKIQRVIKESGKTSGTLFGAAIKVRTSGGDSARALETALEVLCQRNNMFIVSMDVDEESDANTDWNILVAFSSVGLLGKTASPGNYLYRIETWMKRSKNYEYLDGDIQRFRWGLL